MTKKRKAVEPVKVHSFPAFATTRTSTTSRGDRLRRAMLCEAKLLRDLGLPVSATFREVIEGLPIASFERILRDT